MNVVWIFTHHVCKYSTVTVGVCILEYVVLCWPAVFTSRTGRANLSADLMTSSRSSGLTIWLSILYLLAELVVAAVEVRGGPENTLAAE